MSHSIERLRITFYKSDGRFHEGGTLAGNVKFTVKQAIAISRLEIRFKGLSNVFWHKALEKNICKAKISVLKLYDSEQYLNQKLNLLTSNPSKRLYSQDPLGSTLFNPGDFIFPFSVQLPHGLPPSFAGDYGEVKYVALVEAAYADLLYPSPSSSSDLSFHGSTDEDEEAIAAAGFGSRRTAGIGTAGVGALAAAAAAADAAVVLGGESGGTSLTRCWKEFVVEKVLPLTEELSRPKELVLTKQQNLMMIVKLNDIRCHWRLCSGAFRAGDDMFVCGNIENMGRTKVLKAKVAFIQHVIYRSQKCSGNYIYQRKRLSSKTKTSILPDACGYLREKIHVPADAPPTNQNKGELINIKYSVKLTIVLQSPFKPMKSEMEVTVCTGDVEHAGRPDGVRADVVIEYQHDSYFV